MTNELAAANVNRCYQLAASSIAIFTFLLFFLFPKYASGDIDARAFQLALIVMGVSIFSFAFASFYYYGASLADRFDDAGQIRFALSGDRFWLLGCVLLFLTPCIVLFTIELFAVAFIWFMLWLVYLAFAIRIFPRIRASEKNQIHR